MKTIYFTRHGLTVMNAQGLRCGSTESPLTEKGREQAVIAGKHATSLTIDLIVCSSMGRAVETAEIIAEQIGYDKTAIQKTDLLRERDFGALENKPYIPDQDMDGIEGMEPEAQLETRISQAVEWIEALPGHHVLVVAHGASGRMLRHVLNPTIPFAGASHFSNADIIQLA